MKTPFSGLLATVWNLLSFPWTALARVKRTDLDKARTFVGTCPDMCPEKERYMRETRSQLSVFEVIPGTDQVSPTCPGVPSGPRSVPQCGREVGCAGRGLGLP